MKNTSSWRQTWLFDVEIQEIVWSEDSFPYYLELFPDGLRFAFGTRNGIHIRDLETGNELAVFEPGTSQFFAISPDNTLLLTGYGRMWDIESGELKRQFFADFNRTQMIVDSPNRNWLLTGHTNGLVNLWESSSGRWLRSLEGHSGAVTHGALNSEDDILLTGCSDGILKWWDVETWEEIRSLQFPASKRLIVSPDQTRVLTSDIPEHHVYDLESGEEILMFTTPNSNLIASAFSPDGSQVAVTDSLGAVKVMSTHGGGEIRVLNPGGLRFPLMYSADGSRLATPGPNSFPTVWDTTTWERIWPRAEAVIESEGYDAVAMSPGGSEVVMLLTSGNVALWNIDRNELVGFALAGHSRFEGFAAFSSDGESIFISNRSSLVQWHTADLKSVVPLEIRQITQDENTVHLTIDGPAITAWDVRIQARSDLSSESDWVDITTVNRVTTLYRVETYPFSISVSVPWEEEPKLFRAYVLSH